MKLVSVYLPKKKQRPPWHHQPFQLRIERRLDSCVCRSKFCHHCCVKCALLQLCVSWAVEPIESAVNPIQQQRHRLIGIQEVYPQPSDLFQCVHTFQSQNFQLEVSSYRAILNSVTISDMMLFFGILLVDTITSPHLIRMPSKAAS